MHEQLQQLSDAFASAPELTALLENPELESRVKAEVLARVAEGSDELVDEIKGFVRQRLSAYAYPRKIEFVDDLPKTLTGKIRRIELRERETEAAKG